MSHSSSDRPAPPWRATARLLVPLVGLAVFAAACAGSSSKTSSGAPTTTSTGAAARASFITCLEQHGVPASIASTGFGRGNGPGGAQGTGGGSSTTVNPVRTEYSDAFRACRSDLPTRGGVGGFQNSPAGKAYLNCLEAHGVTVPTTAPGSDGTGGRPGAGGGFAAITQQPAYNSAAAACAPLRPQFGGSTTTTTA